MTDPNSFDELYREVMTNRDARVAASQHRALRGIGMVIEGLRVEAGLSIREFGRAMGTKSLNQVQRVCGKGEVGHSLTLRTLCRAADVFGYDVVIELRKREEP